MKKSRFTEEQIAFALRQGVLDAADELLGRLAIDDLAVGPARVTEHDAEDMSLAPSSLAVRLTRVDGHDHRRAGAEVDLGLGTWFTLHPPEWQRPPKYR